MRSSVTSPAAARVSATCSNPPRRSCRTWRPSEPSKRSTTRNCGRTTGIKQYYSGLTDILRTYIAARWGFGAMEMTSDEIIETMRPEELPDKARMDLTAILRDADLVKFAKATPEAEQNEADYLKAYYFVEETKPVEEEAPAEEESPKQN